MIEGLILGAALSAAVTVTACAPPSARLTVLEEDFREP